MSIYDLTVTYGGRKSFYGKAKVYTDGKTQILYSYNTPVCQIKNGKFIKLWDGYSATTARHIHDFRLQNGFAPMPKKEWEKLEVKKFNAF